MVFWVLMFYKPVQFRVEVDKLTIECIGNLFSSLQPVFWIVYNVRILYNNYAARNRTRSNFKMDVFDSCLRFSLQKKNE